MPTNHNPVFRCPVDAMDEIIPSLTLAQWAQGGSESEHCDSCGNTQFRTYEPGEIVRFQASQTLTVITYTYGQNGMEGPEPPAGVTRFVAENDFENQQETLEAFHRERGEYGIELGDTITLECIADWTEYWRCEGEYGRPKTYTFVPSSMAEYVAKLDKALDDLTITEAGLDLSTKRLLARSQAPISRQTLQALIWEVKTLLEANPNYAAGGQTR